MGRFEFRSKEIELDIAGVHVSVPRDIAYVEKLGVAGERMKDFGAKMQGDEDIDASLDFMLDILDDLLGEKAVDAIEAERELDVYDCLDLVTYVSKEVQNYHSERSAAYKTDIPLGMQAPVALAQAVENRETRRARERAERRKARRK